MSTSQVCEINNNKKFTVLNLQIVCQKECGTIKWGHFFSRQIILSMQGKHASHLSRLFQILNTAINQKTQKILVINTFSLIKLRKSGNA